MVIFQYTSDTSDPSDTGCSLTYIEQELQGQFDSAAITRATEFLSSEGYVQTIDDNHFLLSAS